MVLHSHRIKQLRTSRYRPYLLILAVVMLIGAATGAFFDSKKQDRANTNEIAEITREVSGLIELPNEQPTLATVTDKNKLEKQPFFEKAENGDKVLIYLSSRKALLYRPSTKKIVDFGTVNIVDAPAR